MKKIFFKNLSEMNEEENQTFVFDENLLGIKINNEQFVALSDIPRIFIDIESDIKKDVLFYFNKGISEYIIFKSGKQGIIKCFEIKQEMQNQKTIIGSINGVLCIDNKNLLYNIINYNSAMIKRLLIDDLPIILEKLPFTPNEIEWYRNNISDIFNRKTLLDTTKENVKAIVKYKPKKNNKLDFPLMFEGKKYSSLRALANDYNIQDDTLRARLKKGMNLEEALTTPIANTGKRVTNLKNMAIKIDNNQISIGDEM